MGLRDKIKESWNQHNEQGFWGDVRKTVTFPFRVLFFIIAWLFKGPIIVVVFLVIILILILPFTAYRSGSLGVWAQEAQISLGKIPFIGPAISTISSVAPAIWSPESFVELQEEYTWKATVDDNVGNQDLGLEFDDFKAQPDIYDKDNIPDKIIAFGDGQINSLMDDSELTFECDADNGEIQGEITNPYGPIKLQEGITKYFRARCEYDGKDFEIGDELQTSYTLRLKADYSFNTLGYLTIYTLSQDKLEEYKYDKENIFSNINDKHLNKGTGGVESTYTSGPVKLILHGYFDQPLSEEGPFGDGSAYNLAIILKRDINWDGTLREIKNIYFYTMEGIDLEEGSFEYVEDGGLFKKYRISNGALEELNSRCLNEFKVFDLDCWKGSNVATYVDFIINVNEEELTQLYLQAEVEYIYQSEIKELIKFT
ncbi:MAG: hypothetical protein KJ674_00900 [Nanoarchaeota archaeon]|nr:hypothetical protein [Nanoarchaeota archaeon]